MEERDFHDETSDVLSSLFFDLARDAGESQPRFGSRMSNHPSNRLRETKKSVCIHESRRDDARKIITHTEHMTLHLNERTLVIRAATHLT